MLRHHKKNYNDKWKPAISQSERLRKEIDDLEDALILHARIQSENDNSVKEMIRKELGTTHWEHGGEGKLTTYKSGKDLGNQRMREHCLVHKKVKDTKKQYHTASGDKDNDKLKRGQENSDVPACTSADRKARKLKKIKSTLDKKELEYIKPDAEKMSLLKITSLKATTASDESCEMTFETANEKQDTIVKPPSLKDETSIIRKEKYCSQNANNNSKLYLNAIDKKHRKNSSYNCLPDSLKVSGDCKITASKLTAKEVPRAGTKMAHTKSASEVFVQDNSDFISGIQLSFNSTETNSLITKIKLKTQDLGGRIDTDDSLMFQTVNQTNKSDSNQVLCNEFEWPRSKTLVGNMDLYRNNYYDSGFLSSKQDKIVDTKEKWAVTNSDVLLRDLDYIQVPCGSSCTKDDCGNILTDFDVLENLQDGRKHACLFNGDFLKNHKQQNETNKEMLSSKESSEMFSTTRQAFSAGQSSVPLLKTFTTNKGSELNSSLMSCSGYEQADAASVQAVSPADLSMPQHRILCEMPLSLPETDSPTEKSSHEVDMESWLHNLGLESVEHYVKLFHEHHVDISRVQLLSATDLREMGIHAIGPIMKIMKGVLVLGRDKHLLCGSCDYKNSGDKQWECDIFDAKNVDNHIDGCDLAEMPTKFSCGLKNVPDNNNMCQLEHSCDKTVAKLLSSPVLLPGKSGLFSSLDDDKLAKLDFGTTGDLKSSDDSLGDVSGGPYAVKGMFEESSRPKETVNKRQVPIKRRAKQSVLGVCGKPPVNRNEIVVAAQKFHMKEKKISAKEANGRNMMRQKQLQDLESNIVAVEKYENEKDGIEKELFTVCNVQGDLNVPEKQSVESTFRRLQKSFLEQDNAEPLRFLHSTGLNKHKNLYPDHESMFPSSTKKRNVQERKWQEDNMRQNIVNEEKGSFSEKAYPGGDNQSPKVKSSRSQYKDLQFRQELPGSDKFNRHEQINYLIRENNDENPISGIVKDDIDDATEIQKDTIVEQPVTVTVAETRLLKSKRSQHASLRNRGQLRRQENQQPEKFKRAGSGQLDSFKKVELNRNDIVFSEKDLLGSGTFSQVFKGTYQGSEVAVKRLQVLLQTRDLTYFVSEISTLQELKHPHVAMILGVCSRREKFPLIVMEFVACGNLHTRLHGPGRTDLKREEFYQIAQDVSAGLLYLHNHQPQVLHLDLKPKNILIGDGARAKVAGFGFTKLRFKDDVKLHHRRESPTWMAPELFSSGEITSKADVYSFGMVLWEMLTRQHPYENFSVFQILESVQANRRPPLPSDCPKGLNEIVQKCWHQNPAARPGFKEVSKRLKLLSQTSDWITSPQVSAELENQVTILNFTPEYSRDIEYNIRGQMKASEKTSNVDHIDLISLSSQDYEESNSCKGGEGKSLSDLQESCPEKSRFCDIISLTDNTSGVKAFSDQKSSLCSTDVEQPRFSLPFRCSSSISCLSLHDNEKDSEEVRNSTVDKFNDMYLNSRKPLVSVSKSQDSLRNSASVKKLLPLRNSLERSKVMPVSFQDEGFKLRKFFNPQTTMQTNHQFMDEDMPDKMWEDINTTRDSVKNPALACSVGLVKGQDTHNSISVREDTLKAPYSEALLYLPSFHDKVTPVRLTTKQELSGFNSQDCHESTSKDQSNHLKESQSCNNVEMQPVIMFMNSKRETHDHTMIKAHDITLKAGNLDLDNTKSCRMGDMNQNSHTAMVFPSDQATESSLILTTQKSKQGEAHVYHLINNIPNEKENPLDRKIANVCFLGESLKSPEHSVPSSGRRVTQVSGTIHGSRNKTDYENSQSLVHNRESVDIQMLLRAVDKCSKDPAPVETVLECRIHPNVTVLNSQDDCLSTYLHKHTSKSGIETPATRSRNIHTASLGSDHVPNSSRSDDILTWIKSGNIPTYCVRSYNQTFSVSDHVHICSARSDNVQITSAGTDNILIPSAKSDNVHKSSVESDNVQIPSARSDNVQIPSARSDNVQIPSARSDNVQIPSARSDNVKKSSVESDNVQIPSARSDNVQKSSVESDNVQIPSARSDNVQKSSVESDNVQIPSARSDNFQKSSVESDNVQIPSARSDIVQIPSARSDNVQIPSARSDNVQIPSARSDNVKKSSVESDNVQIPSARSDNVQKSSVESDNVQIPSARSDNVQKSSVESDNVQIPSARSDNVQKSSVESDNVQILSARSDNVQISSARSDNVQISSARSDKVKKSSTRSHNVQKSSVESDNVQIPFASLENVHIPSERSYNIQTLATPCETGGFSKETDYATEADNCSTSQHKEHETTTYESDSDSSTISDISLDSLNKDVAACPQAVNISQNIDSTRCTSSAIMNHTDIILKNKAKKLPIADNLSTESSSACNPCLTYRQGVNAQPKCVQSEEKNRTAVTDFSLVSLDAVNTKYNKIHNKAEKICSEFLGPEVQTSYHLKSLQLAKSHEEMLQKEQQSRNITECKKVPQSEKAEQHKLMTVLSSQRKHLLKQSPSGMRTYVTDANCVHHNEDKAKNFLSSHSKQISKHSEGSSHFSVDANILVAQKKLLKPVAITASSFSVNTLNASEDRPQTVITILKKAMTDRRFAMGDILESQELTPETSWSLED